MTDIIALPSTAAIASMAHPDLIATYNAFASTNGQNPVRRFATRSDGVKRLTALADALRAKGITEASAPTEFPVIAKAKDVPAPKSPKAKAQAKPVKPTPSPKAKPATVKASAKPQPTKIVIGQRGTLGARLRELINDGLDNAAIWAIVQPEYDLEDNKRGYVSGQRIYMAKRGL